MLTEGERLRKWERLHVTRVFNPCEARIGRENARLLSLNGARHGLKTRVTAARLPLSGGDFSQLRHAAVGEPLGHVDVTGLVPDRAVWRAEVAGGEHLFRDAVLATLLGLGVF